MSVALLVGATSGIAYAATDGATANPFKAVKIYINGEELDAAMQKNEDGSYTVHMKKATAWTRKWQTEAQSPLPCQNRLKMQAMKQTLR